MARLVPHHHRMITWAGALASAEQQLRSVGIEEARVDAELLLAHLLETRPTMLRLDGQRELSPPLAARYDDLIAARARRRPLPYLTGSQEFMGCPLAVDERVLIPRWDTEPLVERLLAELADVSHPRLADLCTGSGAVAVALASARPDARIWATDLSREALAVAAANVRAHGLAGRVACLWADLAAPLTGPLDAIFCNPPYVAEPVLATLAPEVRDHEPRLALAAGADGLDLLRRLAPQLARLLAPGGIAVIEHGDEQATQVAELFAAAGLEPVATLLDLGGRDRGILTRAWR